MHAIIRSGTLIITRSGTLIIIRGKHAINRSGMNACYY